MKNSDPKTDIIIVNHNGWQDTKECLRSLLDSSCQNFSIILIDNGSENDGLKKFERWALKTFKIVDIYSVADVGSADHDKANKIDKKLKKKNLVLIKSEYNLGFAGGSNVGIGYSINTGSDYVLLLNNDTIVSKDSIGNLLDFLESNRNFLIAIPQLRYHEPSDMIWNCGGKISRFGTRKYYYSGINSSKIPLSGYMKVSFTTGCALMFDPGRVGFLSERFFFGEEDFELSLRLKREKKLMACVFDSIIYHKVGSSINRIYKEKLNMINIHYLNRFVNLKSFYPGYKWRLVVFLYILYIGPMIKIRHKYKIRKIYSLLKYLIKESKELKSVNKSTFDLINRRTY